MPVLIVRLYLFFLFLNENNVGLLKTLLIIECKFVQFTLINHRIRQNAYFESVFKIGTVRLATNTAHLLARTVSSCTHADMRCILQCTQAIT